MSRIHSYINDSIVLRTQTSPVQARTMEKGKLPIRMIAPGRVFRSDEVDATHSPSFHQIEGLVIDKNITFADLERNSGRSLHRSCSDRRQRQNSDHIISRLQSQVQRWMLPALNAAEKAAVSVKVPAGLKSSAAVWFTRMYLRMCGIDPDEYTGFAFGVGLERIALLKYEIDDMRLLYENDVRFLKQF